MSSKTVAATLFGVSLLVTGDFTSGKAPTQYARNGDPGDPGEADQFEIEEVLTESGDELYGMLECLTVKIKGQEFDALDHLRDICLGHIHE